jgi:hypothetical protein
MEPRFNPRPWKMRVVALAWVPKETAIAFPLPAPWSVLPLVNFCMEKFFYPNAGFSSIISRLNKQQIE